MEVDFLSDPGCLQRLSAGHLLGQGLAAAVEQPQLLAGLVLGLEQRVEEGGLVRGLMLEKHTERVHSRGSIGIGRPREPRVAAIKLGRDRHEGRGGHEKHAPAPGGVGYLTEVTSLLVH